MRLRRRQPQCQRRRARQRRGRRRQGGKRRRKAVMRTMSRRRRRPRIRLLRSRLRASGRHGLLQRGLGRRRRDGLADLGARLVWNVCPASGIEHRRPWPTRLTKVLGELARVGVVLGPWHALHSFCRALPKGRSAKRTLDVCDAWRCVNLVHRGFSSETGILMLSSASMGFSQVDVAEPSACLVGTWRSSLRPVHLLGASGSEFGLGRRVTPI
mmetsp:Transcript_150652/g.482068  ORF Transcript_150652/g.482068 Transcript_150652/m.482068 type:complete len:213 (+) Transcript_150652:110-748(+)